MKRKTNLGGYLFGGVFFASGALFFSLFVGSQLLDVYHMQTWHSVDAELLRAKITSHQSRNDNGSYTTMYKVVAQYRYQVDGTSYEGDRPSISTGSSSDRDDHEQLLKRIKSAQQRNGHIVVWYNPDNPSESVYSRKLNWRLLILMTLFTGIFIIIGGGIIGYTFVTGSDDAAIAGADSDKPWTTRSAWASSNINSQAQGSTRLAWFLVVLSVLFFGTFTLAMFGQHPVATAIAVLLPIIPLLVLKRAIRLQREWRRFGHVPLQLDPYPGVIGGQVGGQILVPTQLNTGDHYLLTLKCIKHWTTRNGSKTRSHSGEVWSEQQSVDLKNDIHGTRIKFQFNVPAGLPPSSEPDSSYHKWVLSVKGDMQGIDFEREYELPVFITVDSKSVTEELEQTPLKTSERHEVEKRLSLSRNGETINMEMPRQSSAVVLVGISGAFIIVGIGIGWLNTQIFGYIFALVGCLFFTLAMWVWGRNSKIAISANSCDVQVFWFNYLVKHHQLSSQDVRSIDIYRSSSSTSGNSKIDQRFGLRLLTNRGRRIDIGGEFKSERNATYMKQELERILE